MVTEELLTDAIAAVRTALKSDMKPGETMHVFLGRLTSDQLQRLREAAYNTGLCDQSGSLAMEDGNGKLVSCGPYTFTRNAVPRDQYLANLWRLTLDRNGRDA